MQPRVIDDDVLDALSIEDLLAVARKRDIALTLDGDHLRVSAPKGALSLELRRVIADRKPELMDVLSATAPIQPRTEGYAGLTPYRSPRSGSGIWINSRVRARSTTFRLRCASAGRWPWTCCSGVSMR